MEQKCSKLNLIRIIIASAAVIALVIGVISGEAAAVYQKAVRICMECIGLG